MPIKILDLKCANYLWDLINHNGKQIAEDFNYLVNSSKENFADSIDSSVHVINKQKVFIGKDVTIKPGVVLDASGGPIIIDDDASVSYTHLDVYKRQTYRLILAEFFIQVNLMKRAEGELNRLLAIYPSNREARALLDSIRAKT